MSDRSSNPRALDLAVFCRLGGALHGHWPLADMPRLRDSLSTPPGDTLAAWSAHGSVLPVIGGEAERWLHLQGRAEVTLQCQRCLQDTRVAVAVDRRFRFVRDEDEAARLDEEMEDDVLVMQPRTDLRELFEDELILNLPLVPRHEHCPQPLLPADDATQGGEDAAPHPFAALAALRGRKPDDA